MNSSVGIDIANAQAAIKLIETDTVETFAAKLFTAQMEVYSSYAGRDLYKPFAELTEGHRNSFLELAKKLWPQKQAQLYALE
jgi:hypothetical protein